jgi:hypothetical protein
MVVWGYFPIWKNVAIFQFGICCRWVRIVDPVAKALFSCLEFFADYFPVDSQLSKIAKNSTNKYASRDQEELATDVTSVD